MKWKNWFGGAAALALLVPTAATAQNVQGEWVVDLRGGAVIYDDASAIESGPAVGLDAIYFFTPRLGIGPAMGYVQTQSKGEFFVAVLNFGPDSTRVLEVGQTVGALHYGGVVHFDILPESRFGPYVVGGGGGYRLYLDAQSNEAPTRVDGVMAQAGGGIRWSLTDQAGVQIEARDIIYFDYDREQLNPIDARHRNCGPAPATQCFPGANADLPDPAETVHNFRVSIGFSYVPGLNR